MTQTLNDANGTTAKQAWTTPSIETHDVAQITLGFNGNKVGDGGSNRS